MFATWARNFFSTITTDEPGVQRNLYMHLLGYFLFLGFFGLLYPAGLAIGRRFKKQNTPVIYSFALGLFTVFMIDVIYNHRILSLVFVMILGVGVSFAPIRRRSP
jgi:predicted membrane channel-forming protein YqfA (hemolysin III family)